MTLVYGNDAEIADWVSVQIFGKEGQFKNSVAIGVVDNGRLIAGVVYNNQITDIHDTPYMIEMSVASIDKRWATRHNLKAFFSYPFIQLRLKRVQTHSPADVEGITMFNHRLGFKLEGLHREMNPCGGDFLSWGMLKSECRWING